MRAFLTLLMLVGVGLLLASAVWHVLTSPLFWTFLIIVVALSVLFG